MDLRHPPLTGRHVRLEPFTPAIKDEVGRALDCDPDIWAIIATSAMGEHFERWWTAAMANLEAGRQHPYAVRRLSDGAMIGTSSFLEINPEHDGVEIGSTFYRPEARGGVVNPECKLLLMTHAFDAGAERMQYKVDVRNKRSQAAVTKLGAVREGVLRHNYHTWTGHWRDTVYFSILREEWPGVRTRLEARAYGAA
jgi:RimJ/RimL family protein N-acetyltransferase